MTPSILAGTEPHDETVEEIDGGAVVEHDGQVILEWGPAALTFSPDEADEISAALAKMAAIARGSRS